MMHYLRREDRSPFGNYIEAANFIFHSNPSYHAKLISRDANIVAHTLARSSRSYGSPSTWVEPPAFVGGLLDVSCLNCE